MATLAEEQATALPNVDPGPADVAERHDDVARIEEFLKQLPPNQREVIRLKFQGGLSYREISGVTGLSVSNVGFLLHQGLKTARHHFQQCEKSVKQQDASVVKGERS